MADDVAALPAAVSAARELLKLNSNSTDGGRLFLEGADALQRCVVALPDAAMRDSALRYLSTMKRVRHLKTVGSWRPYVICILRALGAVELDVDVRRSFVKPEAIEEAEAEAARWAAAEQNGEELHRKRTRKEPAAKEPAEQRAQTGRVLKASGEAPAELSEHQETPETPWQTEPASSASGKAPAELPEHQEETPEKRSQTEPASNASGKAPAELAEHQTAPSTTKRPRTGDCSHLVLAVVRKQTGIERFMVSKSCGALDAQQQVQEKSCSGDTSPLSKAEGSSSSSSSGAAGRQPGSERTESSDPQGYYATLGLTREASADDLRVAYKRSVLIAHPDKGGSAHVFRKIVDAYNVLSHLEQRAEYDGEGSANVASRTASSDGDGGRAGHGTRSADQVAKDAFVRLLVSPQDAWGRLLEEMDVSVVEALRTALDGVVASMEPRQKRNGDVQADDSKSYSGPGLKRNKDRTWWVQIGWRSFKVTTEPIESLERAVNIHVALVHIRNVALARHKKVLADLAALCCSGKTGSNDLDDCPMLTHAELVVLLQEEPYIPLLFCSDLNNPRIQTRWTPSLESASRFRLLVRRTQAAGGDIGKVKRLMSQQAKEDRATRKALLVNAVNRVREEAERRHKETIAAAPSHGLLAADSRQEPLALKEVAASEEFLRVTKALEEEKRSHIQALEDRRRSDEDWLKQREQQEERHRQQLLETERKLEETERLRQAHERIAETCLHALQCNSHAVPSNPFRRGPSLNLGQLEADRAAESRVFEVAKAAERELLRRPRHRPTALEPSGSYSLLGREPR